MAIWYIATDGNDTTGDGSKSTPWRHPPVATTKVGVADGDTFYLAPGNYSEDATTIWDFADVAANRRTYTFAKDPAEAGDVVLDTSESDGSTISYLVKLNATGTDYTFKNITFGNTNNTGTFRQIRCYANDFILHFEGCTFDIRSKQSYCLLCTVSAANRTLTFDDCHWVSTETLGWPKVVCYGLSTYRVSDCSWTTTTEAPSPFLFLGQHSFGDITLERIAVNAPSSPSVLLSLANGSGHIAFFSSLNSVTIDTVTGTNGGGLFSIYNSPVEGTQVTVKNNDVALGGLFTGINIGVDDAGYIADYPIVGAVVENNTIKMTIDRHGISTGMQSDSCIVRYNKVSGGCWNYVNKGTKNYYHHNTGHGTRMYLDTREGNSGNGTGTTAGRCEHNSFYVTAATGAAFRHAIRIDTIAENSLGGTFKNNIVVFDTTGQAAGDDYALMQFTYDGDMRGFEIDYNVYYIPDFTNTLLWRQDATTGVSLVTLQDKEAVIGVVGADAHSVLSDPGYSSIDLDDATFLEVGRFSPAYRAASDFPASIGEHQIAKRSSVLGSAIM